MMEFILEVEDVDIDRLYENGGVHALRGEGGRENKGSGYKVRL